MGEVLGDGEWTIARPAHGQQGESYVARGREQAVFLKFDSGAPVAALRRLGELGVAPRVLADSRERASGRPYVVWEHVAGDHPPGWRWFAENLPLLAGTTRRFQTDPELGRLLLAAGFPGGAAPGYGGHVSRELGDLRARLERLEAEREVDAALAADLAAMLAELERQARRLLPVPLTPAHGDPNGFNLIIPQRGARGGRLLLVDWDGLALSDPVRDAAQWLCWHVAPERWPVFFAHYGLPMDRAIADRVFWWGARASFANALWHLDQGYPHEVFVRDCRDLLRRHAAPHQVFPGT